MGGQEIDHVRRGVQKGVDAGGVKAIANNGLQIAAGGVHRLDYARILGQPVARQPHPPARPRGGPAQYRRAFGNDYL